ncbi:membrane fusogenic activity family protein [Nocardiopsis changdeensis]|uniref:Membrane fusogenic activity family protein n=1 Tax=Nocardiopsis changdeensis TaxID=2831969 RepID=A0ABX8BS32_9ACTN|nr:MULTISPECIES: membrane fusogenic activity family protein [Nocardiopsis]QUX24573.1 membrane fusogenic activity family protein [Nocardiopsis changdeensis]QYX34961.1 membrane fusogenic activity family protein [Nocardiopsis sp. MT53]
MVVDAVRTYLDAASGLTELSRKEAVAAAKVLLRAGGAGAPAAEQEPGGTPPRVGRTIQALAGELLETSRANREALAELVRSEVEHRLERMDVVPRSEHERLVRRVAELERRLAARSGRERVPSVPAVEVRAVEVEEVPAAAVAAVATAVADPAPDGAAGQDAPEAPEAPVDAESPDGAAAAEPAREDGADGDAEEAGKKPAAKAGAAKPAAKGGRARAGAAKRTTKSRSATKK